MSPLKCFTVAGSPVEIGRALGALAKPVFDAYMLQSAAWKRLQPWRGAPYVKALRGIAVERFPGHVAELDAMADALGWSRDDLFLWNCRGELSHRTQDGCTTLAVESRRGDMGGVIAHNEDGDPYLRGKCMLVDVRPEGKPGFVSFYYPGSLPGHTFAATRAGVAQAINNIRIAHTAPGVPRMILARAVLDARSLDSAVATLSDAPRASGFHHTIGCAGDARIFSVETTPHRCSVGRIGAHCAHRNGISGHANHLIHRGHEQEPQVVTDSSRDRQKRLDELLPAFGNESNNEALLGVLSDRAAVGLPIYRDDPRDPDDENTLATAVMRIGPRGVAFEVHQQGERVYEQFISRAAGFNAD